MDYQIDQQQLHWVEEKLGFRIIMTNRHEWTSQDIITAYYGQSKIEHAFRNMKNPYHLALKPQYHWTDQKIKVYLYVFLDLRPFYSPFYKKLTLALEIKRELRRSLWD